MTRKTEYIPSGKKIYFASDFHLGIPDHETSKAREKKIIRWLDFIKADAHAIYLLGDVFDFWYEYKYLVPKGFVRFQAKLAELTDSGIRVHWLIGNHDMWIFSYFQKELGVEVLKSNLQININGQSFYIGHGDGLGPGDYFYKFLKLIFRNPFFQWVFRMVPPSVGMNIARYWSSKSRLANMKEEKFDLQKEYLYQFCKKMQSKQPHDFYIFGHRHLVLDIEVTGSRYINLGEWVSNNLCCYASFDGNHLLLHTFDDSHDTSSL
ncbi:MAG: UDP-2,3-diacylglucosamine diphosphatase [Cytophagaceae bacterium]|nr:UDP-2,3-diacylglucosamine diphosphatase [Cytophagaceae bacterium]MDW8455331.1 UDP-2,3-diacylglucosamine diphosphatase [Cytophagaceae bacterium]